VQYHFQLHTAPEEEISATLPAPCNQHCTVLCRTALYCTAAAAGTAANTVAAILLLAGWLVHAYDAPGFCSLIDWFPAADFDRSHPVDTNLPDDRRHLMAVNDADGSADEQAVQTVLGRRCANMCSAAFRCLALTSQPACEHSQYAGSSATGGHLLPPGGSQHSSHHDAVAMTPLREILQLAHTN
jgi:hypothetical protein